MSTDTPRTDAEGAACVTINGMSAVTAGSYVRLFNLSKALEKTLGELGVCRVAYQHQNTMHKHVVHFSGGLCSFWTARRVIDKHGPENVTLLFCDTYWEDPGLYVFLDHASKHLGVPVTTLAHGLNPWQLFRAEKMIGSGRADLCSRLLKRELLDKWRKTNTTPETSTFYLGLDWTEGHRLNGTDKKPGGMRAIFAPWRVEAPMMDEPIWDKCRMARELTATGIKLPTLYQLGFPHNNCGGFCVKAGQAHFAHLLKTMPAIYAINEAEEEETRRVVGDYSVMKDRRGGGPRRTLTMRQFRERVEAGETFDRDDWGGCGCSVEPPFLVLGEDGTTHWGNTYRDAIDAAMKEDAK